ncbi:Protein KIAA0664, related [Neospora caninum Liverpool]|uniref:Protein KIAA0664, related n=1 Tax=Neospora caninum (strain Liverpool) TaxID=572307 RepID=F0VR78_NEOCL|nr:Protein KIAA0664, related [Neospora caninum Liverpool]CBZ56226.1 Protein KIAA0664, related [Neospora caninum Liverpool]CEL70988.1 TPA: Protein KIAA0664, related [Neospora caninum Liverpool]|eukprot:XP_003886251.1 Protein KIAA0664, related [Neospora caninum Liverpool]
MELFGDQYIRITIALPASVGAFSVSSSPQPAEAPLRDTSRKDVPPGVGGLSSPLPDSAGARHAKPQGTEQHGSSVSTKVLGHVDRNVQGANCLDSSPTALTLSSSPFVTVVAEVAFHETIAELRWVLLELLPSCFFTNYDVFFRGKRVDENLPFSALSVEPDEVFHLVPLLYDEKAVRLHIRRFQEITVNASVLLMRGLPDPADPAGPYGAFLKRLVHLEAQLLHDGAASAEANGELEREESPAFLDLPAEEDDTEEREEDELREAKGIAATSDEGATLRKKATRGQALSAGKRKAGRGRSAWRKDAGSASGSPGEETETPVGGNAQGKTTRGAQRQLRAAKGMPSGKRSDKAHGRDEIEKPMNLTRLLFRDALYGGAPPNAGNAENRTLGRLSADETERLRLRGAQKISNFLLNSPVTLEPRKKPKCFSSLTTSDFNPPPASRRLQGDLWYLELCTLEDRRLAIICREDGFLVASITSAEGASGRSLDTIFPRNRLICPQEGTSVSVDSERGRALIFHTLSDLLCTYSPAYREVLPSLAPEQLDTDLPYHVMPTLQARNHFLVAKEQKHVPDSNRLEEYLEKVAGVDPWEPERRWNNEVEALRRMRVSTLQDHIDFEKASFKLFVEFQHFALQAAINVREGRLSGVSPSEHSAASSVSDCEPPRPCMQSTVSSVGADGDKQTGRESCGLLPACGSHAALRPEESRGAGSAGAAEVVFRGQLAIERAANTPLPVGETHADAQSGEIIAGEKRRHEVNLGDTHRDRREMKAETRGLELLEMMHAFQRQKKADFGRFSGSAATDQRENEDERKNREEETGVPGDDWQLAAPYPLLIDYAGCRLRCQSVSPQQLLAARSREGGEPLGDLSRGKQHENGAEDLTHKHGSGSRRGEGGSGASRLQDEEEKGVTDAPYLDILEKSVFGHVLGLKTHTVFHPSSGQRERRLLHCDAELVAEAREKQLHLLKLGSLCPADLTRDLNLSACSFSLSASSPEDLNATPRCDETAQKDERGPSRHDTAFEWLRPELMSAFLQFHQRREEASEVTSQAPEEGAGEVGEATEDREAARQEKREVRGREDQREQGLKGSAKDPPLHPLSPQDLETTESPVSQTLPGAVAHGASVSAPLLASSSPSPLEGESPLEGRKRDLATLLQDDLRVRLEHEVYRRVPLLPSFFSEMQTWYKADLGLGFFFQSGSPYAAHLREKTREAAAHILLKCLDLTRSQQLAAVLEHRKEYETLRRELAARGAFLLPSEIGTSDPSGAPSSEETAAGETNEQSGQGTRAMADTQTATEGWGEAQKDGGTPEGVDGDKEADSGEDLSAFQLSAEDRRMMELLGRDVSLLDPSLDLAERSQQLAEQVCNLAFFAQPCSSPPEEGARQPSAGGAAPRLFNLNLERSAASEAALRDRQASAHEETVTSLSAFGDQSVLEEAAKYLHGVAVPLVATLLGQHLCVTPLESSSVTTFFHAFGVNMRYLGAVTRIIETGRDFEMSRDPALDEPATHAPSLAVRTLQLEMTVRAAKWVFAAFFAPLRVGHLSVAVAHLLSCLLCPPGVDYSSKRFPLPASLARFSPATSLASSGAASPSAVSRHRADLHADSPQERALRHLAQLTPDSLWTLVRGRMLAHFGYSAVPANRALWRCMHTPSGRYVVLRGVATALGIQVKAGSPLFSLLGAVSLWERWGVGDDGDAEERNDLGAKAKKPADDHAPQTGHDAEETKGRRGDGRLDKAPVKRQFALGDSEVSTDVMTDADPDSPLSASRAEHARSEAAEAQVACEAQTLRPPDERTGGLASSRRPSSSSLSSAWRAGGPSKVPASRVWEPFSAESVVQLFPVVKREPVVSHFARHLLAAATQCYILGWLDVALELLQQVLFVVHQLTGSVCRETALCYAAMGEVALSLQDFLNAANNFQKALILTERCVGPDHPDTIDIHAGLGRTLVHFPGREFQERGLAHIHRAVELRRLWTGDVPHPETPLLLFTAAKCLLKVYGPRCVGHLAEYLDRAIRLAGFVRGVGPQFVAEMHSDASQIYQAVGDFRRALEHCRVAGQLIAADPSADTERIRELDERLLFLTQQAVLAAKKRKHENVQRAQLLNRLRTAVTLKRHSNALAGPAGLRFPRTSGLTGPGA